MSQSSKIKEIAIISLSHHHSIFLEHLSHLFSGSRFSVTIFGTKQQYQNMKKEKKVYYLNHQWKFEKGNPLNRLNWYIENLNQFDLVIIPTIRNNFKFFSKLKLTTPIVLCVHNINYWFNPKARIKFSEQTTLFSKINYIKNYPLLLIKEKLKKEILTNVSIINIHNPASNNYLKNFTKSHLITNLPFTYYIPNNIPSILKKNSQSPIIYAIPGQIVDNRKDYNNIIKSFSRIYHKLKKKTELHFVGRFNCSASLQQQLLSFSKDIFSDNFRVIIHHNKTAKGGIINDPTFNKIIANCDVLLSAQKKNALKLFKGYKEHFSNSSADGLSFDAIRLIKPAILEKGHGYLEDITVAVDFYTSPKELDKLLLKYQNRAYIQQKTEKMKQVAKKFSRQTILNDFFDKLNS